jgi:small subunit ribosomal protein S6
MRNYEVMYILSPNLQEEAIKSSVDRFASIVTNDGGEMEKVQEIGKKRLAYEINDFREGFYVLMNFQAEPKTVSELERVMKISDDVIRYLIVRDEKH